MKDVGNVDDDAALSVRSFQFRPDSRLMHSDKSRPAQKYLNSFSGADVTSCCTVVASFLEKILSSF
jgi:hypothetical protein